MCGMSPIRSERRVHRSSNPAEALACWLEASRLRNRLRNLALADDLGILVSGSGPERECDELAAWAPIVLKRGERPSSPRLTGVKLPGFDAYVCTEAESGQHTEALIDVAVGCARILGRPLRFSAQES
jgi:hypothetical protein